MQISSNEMKKRVMQADAMQISSNEMKDGVMQEDAMKISSNEMNHIPRASRFAPLFPHDEFDFRSVNYTYQTIVQ